MVIEPPHGPFDFRPLSVPKDGPLLLIGPHAFAHERDRRFSQSIGKSFQMEHLPACLPIGWNQLFAVVETVEIGADHR